MKKLPIIFSTEMVQAILSGQKTVTRRVVTKSNTTGFGTKKKNLDFSEVYGNGRLGVKVAGEDNTLWRGVSRFRIGDYLWVRETWQLTDFLHPSDENYGYAYKASKNGRDWEENSENWKWKPSIFMPKEAARIWLEVKSVKAERLQDITEEDAIAEGMDALQFPLRSFAGLWDSINGNRGFGWDTNPYVWRIEFERVASQNDR